MPNYTISFGSGELKSETTRTLFDIKYIAIHVNNNGNNRTE